jgi:hypothetical protein
MLIVRILGRAMAIALLLCIPLSFMYVYEAFHQPGLVVSYKGDRILTVLDPKMRAMGIRPGDSVDLSGLSVGNRVQVLIAPIFRPFSVVVEHGGQRLVVPMTDVPRNSLGPFFEARLVLVELLAAGSLILGAIVLWRRPGPIAALYAAYALNFLYALPTASFFSFLPDPAFSVFAVIAQLVVATVPQLALVAFALRFPRPLAGRAGKTVTYAVDATLFALLILAAARTFAVPTFGAFDDLWLDTIPTLIPTVALVAIVFVRYARLRGDDRRRLSWVAVGAVASAITTLMIDLEIETVVSLPAWTNFVMIGLQAGLPVAFAYAILRHRVLDLSFALNRTLVYSTITATLVILVGGIDWASGKLLGNSHLSAAIEAAVTIAFGAALSWFHGRVERGVDRLLFRRRYLAATRIERRIAALGYTTDISAVDEALVDEIVAVLSLGSAAVFRRSDGDTFVRAAAQNWESAIAELPPNHLLVRTLRAEERTVVLADAGINDEAMPHGRARPEIAVPIVVRHELLGVALYGHRGDDESLDPEEAAMLGRLVAAGAQAYEAIDAAEWRRRALELQRLPAAG